jgi:competence protein ComGF
MRKTVSAFTLLELLVGMIVSSIVIAATFSAWRIVSQQHLLYRTRHDASREASFFCSALRRDLASSQVAFGATNGLWLNKNERIIHYKVGDDVVLRNDQQQVDTFYVVINKWTCSYHNLQLIEKSRTDRVELELLVNQTPLQMVLLKPESAEEKMQQNLIGEELVNGN